MRLTAGERDRMRELGGDGAEALEDSVRTLTAAITGREMAAELAYRLEVDGIFPFAILAGGDKRRASFRHPNVSAARSSATPWSSSSPSAAASTSPRRGR